MENIEKQNGKYWEIKWKILGNKMENKDIIKWKILWNIRENKVENKGK